MALDMARVNQRLAGMPSCAKALLQTLCQKYPQGKGGVQHHHFVHNTDYRALREAGLVEFEFGRSGGRGTVRLTEEAKRLVGL